MANFKFTSDLLAEALFGASEPTDGTSDFNAEALAQLNKSYQEICVGGSELEPSVNEDWVWLRKSRPAVLNLAAPITSGTVTTTFNSTSLTFSAAPSSSTLINWFFKVDNQPDIFRLAAHSGGSASATLDAAYTGPSGSGLGYTLFQLEYDLATDVLRPIKPMRCFRSAAYESPSYKINGADLNAMEDAYPLVWTQMGVPSLFAPVGETTTGTTRVRFNACGGPDSTTLIRVEYDYLFRPADLTSPGTAEEPVIPLQWRYILAQMVKAFILGEKQDDRAPGSLDLARRGYLGMVAENRKKMHSLTRNAGRVFPRANPGHYYGPIRTESGIIIG